MDEAVKVIKSLLTTASNGGLLVNEINKEYREMVGNAIPFREFGFATLTDFLRSTDQFNGQKTPNGIMVVPKLAGKSAHIIAMRQNQNVSAAERKRRKNVMIKSGGAGGAHASQQPKRMISSQVMKRSGSTVTKPRTRAQPRRVASYNSTVASIVPPRNEVIAMQPINSNTNKTTVHAVPRNLQQRFLPKQLIEATQTEVVPSRLSAISPAKIGSSSKLSTASSSHEHRSPSSIFLARLVSKTVPLPSINSQVTASPKPSDGQTLRSKLAARLAPKQSLPVENSVLDANSGPIGRQALLKLLQNEKSVRCDTQSQPKPAHTSSSSQSEAVSSGRTATRRDLYARLAPKVINETEPANAGGNRSCDELSANARSQRDKLTDLQLRLKPKQNAVPLLDLQQIGDKVRKTCSFLYLYFSRCDFIWDRGLFGHLFGVKWFIRIVKNVFLRIFCSFSSIYFLSCLVIGCFCNFRFSSAR